MVRGEVSESCPASVLQLHPDCTVVVDKLAAAKLWTQLKILQTSSVFCRTFLFCRNFCGKRRCACIGSLLFVKHKHGCVATLVASCKRVVRGEIFFSKTFLLPTIYKKHALFCGKRRRACIGSLWFIKVETRLCCSARRKLLTCCSHRNFFCKTFLLETFYKKHTIFLQVFWKIAK